ncbi:MAG: HPP family protein [Candidatus Bipolaricaulota bacterium]|nr:HPP family protein [Candidatus Bipolaricaulota bacterium]
MRLIDEKFREEPGHYMAQVFLAFVVLTGLILLLGSLTNGTIVAAIGASAFIVFAMPKHGTASPRKLIGGHAVCIGVGLLCSIPFRTGLLGVTDFTTSLVGAMAVSLAIFLMVVTDTEHPPAAGNALAFALFSVGGEHILFTMGAVILLALFRYLLRGWLRDLT